VYTLVASALLRQARCGDALVSVVVTDRAQELHCRDRRLAVPGEAVATPDTFLWRSLCLSAEKLIQANAKTERARYDGFRAFLLGRDPSRQLAEAFARQIVARGEQTRYGYARDAGEKAIAEDFYYWVCGP
jgi:hypothetical protein